MRAGIASLMSHARACAEPRDAHMRRFGKHVFGAEDNTFFESCGVGDVLTSSYAPSGRHRRCAEAFVTTHKGKPWDIIQADLLKGQVPAQHPLTLADMHVYAHAGAHTHGDGQTNTNTYAHDG